MAGAEASELLPAPVRANQGRIVVGVDPTALDERLEQVVIGDQGDAAEIAPVLEAERAVIPQRLKLKASKIPSDDKKAILIGPLAIIDSASGISVSL